MVITKGILRLIYSTVHTLMPKKPLRLNSRLIMTCILRLKDSVGKSTSSDAAESVYSIEGDLQECRLSNLKTYHDIYNIDSA